MFDTETPIPLLRQLRPDVRVKGSDYGEEGLVEADVVRECGGEAVAVPQHAGHSATRLAGVLATSTVIEEIGTGRAGRSGGRE